MISAILVAAFLVPSPHYAPPPDIQPERNPVVQPAPTPPVVTVTPAQLVVSWAMNQIGKPYRSGSAGPGGYDCSGLTLAAYSQVGVSLPHSSRQQASRGQSISKANLLPGDLLVFYGGSHVGIYIGGGKVVHASVPGSTVKTELVKYMPLTAVRRLV